MTRWVKKFLHMNPTQKKDYIITSSVEGAKTRQSIVITNKMSLQRDMTKTHSQKKAKEEFSRQQLST